MTTKDITEAIPYALSNPQSADTYQLTDSQYDVAISGLPFFLANGDDSPYRRVTAQYRKQQYDQTREAGEQSLTGWWFRSQSSFHLGQGIKYFEPAQDESLRFQYTESKGVDVWTKGQATLIYDVDGVHTIAGALKTNGRPNQYMRSAAWKQNSNSYEGVLLLDEYDIDKLFPTITATITNKALTSNVATLTTSAAHGLAVGFEVVVSGVDATFNGTYTITAVTSTTFSYAKTASNVTSTAATGTVTSELEHFVDYNSGTDYPVYAFCDDGVYVYWITKIDDAGVIKTSMYKRPIDSSSSATQMWKTSSIVVADAVMEFTKERIVACINNKVYEIATTATALPTAVYTHPVDDFTYTSITSSGVAIYVTGYSGSQSNIQKFTLSTSTGSMPSLTSAITAAEMPSGEKIYKIYYYLGYMAIGTTKGVRIAVVSDDGSVSYGPLLFESEQPIYDFAARDKYLWCASNVDGAPGTTRIDLSTQLGTLIFPYAWDTYYYPSDSTQRITGKYTTACAFINGTDRIAFCTNKNASNGKIYIESATRLVFEGYLQTGYVRYNTLEGKIFKLLQARVDTTTGGFNIDTISADGTDYNIGQFNKGTAVPEVTIAYPTGALEYLGFKFTLERDSSDNTKGPLFTGYQLKALPAVPRQRLIQLPVFCYDQETDSLGVEVGYEGRAYDRLIQLEQVENQGDTIRVQDFRTGEEFICIIEELDFINQTPSDKRFSGFGGKLVVTVRTI